MLVRGGAGEGQEEESSRGGVGPQGRFPSLATEEQTVTLHSLGPAAQDLCAHL